MSTQHYFLLNLPNPPKKNIYRAFAGGFGTIGTVSEDNILIPQYLLYAASALENRNIEYDILDAQALNYSTEDVLVEVNKCLPDVLIAWLSLPSLDHDMQVLNEIKKAFPETIIITCGTVCKVLSNKILKDSKIDALIDGCYPYYNSISNLVASFNGKFKESLEDVPCVYFKNNGKIISNPPVPEKENLDELNLDVYNKVPVKKYVSDYLDRDYNNISCIPILTGVGCPDGCIYCPYPIGYGKRIVTKSIKKMLKEIEFLMDNHGINGFVFREQTFTYNKRRVFEFCEEVIKRGLDINWFFETRANLGNKKLLTKMREAGCFRIHYGVETGDEEILKKIGKPLLSREKIKKTFHETKVAGIFAHAHMMIGFPDESWDTINRSIKLLKEIEPDGININIVTPYPGTEFYDYILKHSLLTSDEWSMFTSYNPVIRTKNLSGEDLRKARKKMKMEFYLLKIKKDPKFRRFFLKALPRKLWNRLKK